MVHIETVRNAMLGTAKTSQIKLISMVIWIASFEV